jgi:hypothetical protein
VLAPSRDESGEKVMKDKKKLRWSEAFDRFRDHFLHIRMIICRDALGTNAPPPEKKREERRETVLLTQITRDTRA